MATSPPSPAESDEEQQQLDPGPPRLLPASERELAATLTSRINELMPRIMERICQCAAAAAATECVLAAIQAQFADPSREQTEAERQAAKRIGVSGDFAALSQEIEKRQHKIERYYEVRISPSQDPHRYRRTIAVRPVGRARRPATNGRARGSRRSATRAGPSSDDPHESDPDADLDPATAALARELRQASRDLIRSWQRARERPEQMLIAGLE